jgi:hypothetical protein
VKVVASAKSHSTINLPFASFEVDAVATVSITPLNLLGSLYSKQPVSLSQVNVLCVEPNI